MSCGQADIIGRQVEFLNGKRDKTETKVTPDEVRLVPRLPRELRLCSRRKARMYVEECSDMYTVFYGYLQGCSF